jgi:hypothetical protein
MEDSDIKLGNVDGLEDDWIYGWAYDPTKTATQISLKLRGQNLPNCPLRSISKRS